MEPELITSLDQVTPAWVTGVLERTGLLGEARVAEISYDSGVTSFSITTVVHDDIHIGNVLYPRNPTTDTIRIIDWQTWHIDLAVKDFAHIMAIFWFPDQRRDLEGVLLRHYYERLCEDGVADYSFNQLWNDYRLCVIRKLFQLLKSV